MGSSSMLAAVVKVMILSGLFVCQNGAREKHKCKVNEEDAEEERTWVCQYSDACEWEWE